jgi:transposase
MGEQISMEVINSHAAGIDVGSRSHHVAVNQELKDVREFGVYASDHDQMIEWLREMGVKTIAMESTGNYWQTLFAALQSAGFEVILVNGQQTQNIHKTDVKDSRWIQKLHSLGLLTSSFLPSEQIGKIRNYHRHRQSLVEEGAKMVNKMQKALRLMNIRLDVAVSDIMGKSGTAIIEAILQGERSGERLAQLANELVKKSKEEISRALQGNWREELLYELKDCYELYQIFQMRMIKCDREIETLLQIAIEKNNPDEVAPKLTKKKQRKNQPKFDLATLSYLYTGVDLFAIEGVSYNTVMAFIAEVGTDIKKFPTAKKFCNWLRLAPNNKISGNKRISSRTPKGKHKLAQSLLHAANAIGKTKKGALTSFFKRIAYKKGREAAIIATARKVAVIIWNMIDKQMPYKPLEEKIYNEKIKQNVLNGIRKKMERLDLSINDLQTG